MSTRSYTQDLTGGEPKRHQIREPKVRFEFQDCGVVSIKNDSIVFQNLVAATVYSGKDDDWIVFQRPEYAISRLKHGHIPWEDAKVLYQDHTDQIQCVSVDGEHSITTNQKDVNYFLEGFPFAEYADAPQDADKQKVEHVFYTYKDVAISPFVRGWYGLLPDSDSNHSQAELRRYYKLSDLLGPQWKTLMKKPIQIFADGDTSIEIDNKFCIDLHVLGFDEAHIRLPSEIKHLVVVLQGTAMVYAWGDRSVVHTAQMFLGYDTIVEGLRVTGFARVVKYKREVGSEAEVIMEIKPNPEGSDVIVFDSSVMKSARNPIEDYLSRSELTSDNWVLSDSMNSKLLSLLAQTPDTVVDFYDIDYKRTHNRYKETRLFKKIKI